GKTQELHVSTLDLNALLRNRADFFAELAAQKDIRIKCENLENTLPIEADEKRLTEVFDNLLQNALRAVSNNGKIIIRSDISDDFVRVAITDNGEGINGEAQKKIFEPFFTTRTDGAGLGLAITREIIE